MELLKERILSEGRVIGEEILKVDSFLNQQIDVELLNEIGKEFKKLFSNKNINKILTIEASGIAIASIAAQYFKVPVVFAKKFDDDKTDDSSYEARVFSFTKNKGYKIRVSKRYLNKEDRILLIDDFLANGQAVLGLENLVEQAGAETQGIGIVIEKSFQEGRSKIEKLGLQIESLAIIEKMENGKINFK